MEQESDKPSRKKPFFPVNRELRSYLKTHGREINLPVSYNDLLKITYSIPLKDKAGRYTLGKGFVRYEGLGTYQAGAY